MHKRFLRNLMMITALVGGLSLTALAQGSKSDLPRVDVFGGYSYLHTDFHFPDLAPDNMNGWEAAVTVNANKWLGVTADVSGHYGSKFVVGPLFAPVATERPTDYNFLVGPQVSYRGKSRVTPFAHALFGASRANVLFAGPTFNAKENDTAFALALGGGVDFDLTRNIAIRAVQVDWVRTKFFDDTQNNARISTGIVFRFGR